MPASPAAGPDACRSAGGRGHLGRSGPDLAARAARSREHGERPLRGLGGRWAGLPPSRLARSLAVLGPLSWTVPHKAAYRPTGWRSG